MNQLQIANKLFRHISDISAEPEVTATVVSSVNTLTLELDTPLGVDNNRKHHVVWPQGNNTYSNEPLIIESNTGSTVKLFNAQDKSHILPVGTQVKINSGPLGSSHGYFIEPDNITDLLDKDCFWTVGIMDSQVAPATVGRDRDSIAKRLKKSITFGVLCEVLNRTDDSSADAQYFQKIRPYVFSEQIITKLLTFGYTLPGISFEGGNLVDVSYGLIERDGGDFESLAISHVFSCLLTF